MKVMRLAALFSGGKDSTYAIYLAKKLGHEIKYLATIHSKNPYSYMYHTANIGLTLLQSIAMGIQLVSKESEGEKEKELEDLKALLNGLDIDGVVCGAIESNYQKTRIEKICKELNLKLLAPLWKMDQEKLLREMVKNNFEIIITSVSAQGFDEKWLGRIIDENCINDLVKLKNEFGINVAGEGGEYETFVFNCPLFKRKIKIIEFWCIRNKGLKTHLE
jgi:ABC transporter with metal-binding/Fe-S-binding domain ATP-binding protein